jgi:hypothetical protein
LLEHLLEIWIFLAAALMAAAYMDMAALMAAAYMDTAALMAAAHMAATTWPFHHHHHQLPTYAMMVAQFQALM